VDIFLSYILPWPLSVSKFLFAQCCSHCLISCSSIDVIFFILLLFLHNRIQKPFFTYLRKQILSFCISIYLFSYFTHISIPLSILSNTPPLFIWYHNIFLLFLGSPYVTDVTDTFKVTLLSFCYVVSPPPSLSLRWRRTLWCTILHPCLTLGCHVPYVIVFFQIRTTAFSPARRASFYSLSFSVPILY
jgi:hypothetical protein